jgi:hypothetical protein
LLVIVPLLAFYLSISAIGTGRVGIQPPLLPGLSSISRGSGLLVASIDAGVKYQ